MRKLGRWEKPACLTYNPNFLIQSRGWEEHFVMWFCELPSPGWALLIFYRNWYSRDCSFPHRGHHGIIFFSSEAPQWMDFEKAGVILFLHQWNPNTKLIPGRVWWRITGHTWMFPSLQRQIFPFPLRKDRKDADKSQTSNHSRAWAEWKFLRQILWITWCDTLAFLDFLSWNPCSGIKMG